MIIVIKGNLHYKVCVCVVFEQIEMSDSECCGLDSHLVELFFLFQLPKEMIFCFHLLGYIGFFLGQREGVGLLPEFEKNNNKTWHQDSNSIFDFPGCLATYNDNSFFHWATLPSMNFDLESYLR